MISFSSFFFSFIHSLVSNSAFSSQISLAETPFPSNVCTLLDFTMLCKLNGSTSLYPSLYKSVTELLPCNKEIYIARSSKSECFLFIVSAKWVPCLMKVSSVSIAFNIEAWIFFSFVIRVIFSRWDSSFFWLVNLNSFLGALGTFREGDTLKFGFLAYD